MRPGWRDEGHEQRASRPGPRGGAHAPRPGSRSASRINVQSCRLARILIVDGDPASREPLERAFADEGLEVVVAGDPEAGWEASVAFGPGVVVLGRRLPRAEAEELIARLRLANPDILFVAPAGPLPEMARQAARPPRSAGAARPLRLAPLR